MMKLNLKLGILCNFHAVYITKDHSKVVVGIRSCQGPFQVRTLVSLDFSLEICFVVLATMRHIEVS